MIFTDRTIMVKNGTSSINDTIVLYRGDKEVEIRFTLSEGTPFKFGSGASPNIIEKTEATYGQLVIKTPGNLPPIFSEVAPTIGGKIIFTITAEMIDEITEVGNYTFQIRLLDESRNSRATLPEVVNGIEIREPIASEDITNTNEVNVATVGYALTTADTQEDTFDSQGNYNRTTWGTGDRITASKLNKAEAGIYDAHNKINAINNKVEENTTNTNTARQDISDIKLQIGTEELTTTSKKIKGAINDLSSQINTIAKKGERVGIEGWKKIFELNRDKKIVIIGDSTSDPITTSSNLWDEIKNYYMGSGDLLEGANIVNIAQNGSQIRTFILGYNQEGKNLPDAVAQQGDLYVISYGINDVRLGETTKEQLIEYFQTVINELLIKTKGYILLRMPNSLGLTDPTNTGWVSPLSSAQKYTDILYETYKYFESYSPRVAVLDTQTLLFGRTCKDVATNDLMEDVLHPAPLGYKRLARLLVDTIGIKSKYREDLRKEAFNSNPVAPYLVYPKILENDNKYIIVNQGYIKGCATNYVDFYGDMNKISEIKNGDIIKVGDLFAYEFTGNVYNMGSTYIRFAEQTFTGLTGEEKCEVKIFRDLTKLKAPETVIRTSFTVNANSSQTYNPNLSGNKRYKFSLLVDGGFMFGDFFNEGSVLYKMSEVGTSLTYGNNNSVVEDGKWSVYISAVGGEITIENRTTASRKVTLYVFPINY